jgi:hypothetical protein
MMGMVKSAARTLLQNGERLDTLLPMLNTVLFDLKGPAMFATFAGLQFDRANGLRFTVAGNLPILWYRSAGGRYFGTVDSSTASRDVQRSGVHLGTG